MRILLHVCCGPCAAFPVKHLKEQGYDITGLFYNPNIHPYKEFRRRLETAVEFAEKADFELIVDDHYLLEEYLRQVMQVPHRCRECYNLRLRVAAKYAKDNKFDAFSTTLLVSPYQHHEIIKETAQQIAEQEQIPFFYVDFRSGWQEGVGISREMQLYRQPYCGCIFSERDRYLKPRKE